MQERWKNIPGFEGSYDVSDKGRVASLPRRVIHNNYIKGKSVRYIKGRILRPGLSSNGYLTVALAGRSYLMQDLVLLAFVGPKPDGFLSCHNDGNKTNNQLNNLRYDTPSANNIDISLHDRRKVKGHILSKIKADLQAGVSQNDIAARYDVTQAYISLIHRGKLRCHG